MRITAVQVYPGRVRSWIFALVRWTEHVLGLASRLPWRAVVVNPRQLAGGFARYPDDIAGVCRRVQRDTGLVIDPVFGGKTWAAMEATREVEGGPLNEGTLYWYCGSTPDWERFRPLVNGSG